MNDPVMASDGNTYERNAITMLFRGHLLPASSTTQTINFSFSAGKTPLGYPLLDQNLIPNKQIKEAIRQITQAPPPADAVVDIRAPLLVHAHAPPSAGASTCTSFAPAITALANITLAICLMHGPTAAAVAAAAAPLLAFNSAWAALMNSSSPAPLALDAHNTSELPSAPSAAPSFDAAVPLALSMAISAGDR
jgi:hypothetical protein